MQKGSNNDRKVATPKARNTKTLHGEVRRAVSKGASTPSKARNAGVTKSGAKVVPAKTNRVSESHTQNARAESRPKTTRTVSRRAKASEGVSQTWLKDEESLGLSLEAARKEREQVKQFWTVVGISFVAWTMLVAVIAAEVWG